MTLLRTLIGGGLERDEAEQILLQGHWALGYGPQPPLYTWIQNLIFSLFGATIFSLALLKNMLLLGTYLLVYRSALLLNRRQELAAIAAGSIFLIPTISWQCQRDLTHTVLALFMAAATLYTLLWIRSRSREIRWFHYGALGLVTGLGLLSKYNYPLFLAALFLAALADRELRRLILDPRFLLTLLTALLVAAPHLYWIAEHFREATGRTVGKMHIGGEFQLWRSLFSPLTAALALLAPLLVLFFTFFGRELRRPGNRLLRNYLIALTLLLILFALASHATHFKSRWLAPLYFPTAIYLVTFLAPEALPRRRIARYMQTILTVMVIILTVYITRVFFPDLAKNPPRFVFPYPEVIRHFQARHPQISTILYGSNLVGGNFRLRYPSNTTVQRAEAETLKRALNTGEKVLLIWDKDSRGTARLLPAGRTFETMRLPYRHSDSTKRYTLYWAILSDQQPGP